jgi:hypothetical protein
MVETRAKVALSTQGVAVLASHLETGESIPFTTQSEAAKFFECSLRTISRSCVYGQPYAFKGVVIHSV